MLKFLAFSIPAAYSEQKDKLNKIYQGKLSVLESESNYSSDTDRMKKLANSL